MDRRILRRATLTVSILGLGSLFLSGCAGAIQPSSADWKEGTTRSLAALPKSDGKFLVQIDFEYDGEARTDYGFAELQPTGKVRSSVGSTFLDRTSRYDVVDDRFGALIHEGGSADEAKVTVYICKHTRPEGSEDPSAQGESGGKSFAGCRTEDGKFIEYLLDFQVPRGSFELASSRSGGKLEG